MSKTIIVTGASRGIGRAIAKNLASDPDTNLVLNCAKNKELLLEVQKEILLCGAKCELFVGDLADYQVVEELFAFTHEHFGNVDILINNAGISIVGLFQDMTRTDWDKIINTNLGSVYNCCHFAVTDMLHNHSGKIINISSVWGIVGASCEVAYSASKGAINALTQALAKELAPSNIQVNAIACGAIDTDMNSFLCEEDMSALIDEIPSGRLGQPEDVAELVSNLVHGNNYLTGQIIKLDGGWI